MLSLALAYYSYMCPEALSMINEKASDRTMAHCYSILSLFSPKLVDESEVLKLKESDDSEARKMADSILGLIRD